MQPLGIHAASTLHFPLSLARTGESKYFLACIMWLGTVAVAFGQIERGPSVRNAASFPGKDIGAQINAAYSALPATGGAIMVMESASFDIPIVFGTKNKPVLLMGLPGDIVTLTYTGATGTALTFDYGTGHRMGHGLRDLTLTGPGNSTNTTGVIFGGGNGAEGIAFRDFKIQSFGTNLQMGSNTWHAFFEHGMIRDGGSNVLLPSGLTQAGEQIVFNHVAFADALSTWATRIADGCWAEARR